MFVHLPILRVDPQLVVIAFDDGSGLKLAIIDPYKYLGPPILERGGGPPVTQAPDLQGGLLNQRGPLATCSRRPYVVRYLGSPVGLAEGQLLGAGFLDRNRGCDCGCL